MMKITASTSSDYMVRFDHNEKQKLPGIFSDVEHVGFGWYSPPAFLQSTLAIKDLTFTTLDSEYTHLKTAFYQNVTQLAGSLDLVFSVDRGVFVPKSSINAKSINIFTAESGYLVANHIPQICYPYLSGIITSINGDYDLKRSIFRGYVGVSDKGS